jgi:hypothetical protein
MVAGENETSVGAQRGAEAVLRAVHEHSVDEPIERIASLIHPEAEMRLLVSYGQVVRGRPEITRALQHGRAAETFRAKVEQFQWLDESTSLTSAQARYPLASGGFAEGKVYWLDEIRAGMIWRIHVFKTEEAAREAYEARHTSGEPFGSPSQETP